MNCRACEEPNGGYAHTCAGSGTFLAAEAHASGEVDAIEQGWPRFKVDVALFIRAADEKMAREKLTPMVEAILSDDSAEQAEFTVTAEEPVA